MSTYDIDIHTDPPRCPTTSNGIHTARSSTHHDHHRWGERGGKRALPPIYHETVSCNVHICFRCCVVITRITPQVRRKTNHGTEGQPAFVDHFLGEPFIF